MLHDDLVVDVILHLLAVSPIVFITFLIIDPVKLLKNKFDTYNQDDDRK